MGSWQDNKGNYGKSKNYFYVEEFKDNTLIKGLAQFIDQENNILWFIPEETDQEAGVGKVKIIDASKNIPFNK